MSEALEKIFGSSVRLKLLKLFIFNENTSYSYSLAAGKIKVHGAIVRREITNLQKVGFLHRGRSSKVATWSLDQKFKYKAALKEFFNSTDLIASEKIAERAMKIGKIQLLLISGIFTRDPESRVDLFIVGDNVKKTALKKFIESMEAQMGREIRYAYFTTVDFKYRYAMLDKLIRDVLDFPHRKLIDKIGV